MDEVAGVKGINELTQPPVLIQVQTERTYTDFGMLYAMCYWFKKQINTHMHIQE